MNGMTKIYITLVCSVRTTNASGVSDYCEVHCDGKLIAVWSEAEGEPMCLGP